MATAEGDRGERDEGARAECAAERAARKLGGVQHIGRVGEGVWARGRVWARARLSVRGLTACLEGLVRESRQTVVL